MICEKHSDCEDCRTRDRELVDRLREALRAGEHGWIPYQDKPHDYLASSDARFRESCVMCGEPEQYKFHTATPSADGLEAQCRDLIRENSTLSSQLGETPSQTFKRIGDKIATFIRSRDRKTEAPAEQPRCSHGELVEKLEELAAKWEYYVPGVGGTGDYVSELRAVLAARNEGNAK